MKIVSSAEMRDIDRATSERFGVPSLTLMENAGSAVTKFILSEYGHARRIGVICGKGNNGGDGFVVARQLSESGRVVRVLLLCGPEELRGDAAAMFQRLQILPLVARDARALDLPDAVPVFEADLIVDAILGTGFHPPVGELYSAAISRMNSSRASVVAVDIPSGADADAMQAPSANVARADAVVTFTAPRPAHVFAGLTAGPTVIAPIGSPPEAIQSKLELHLSTAPDFAELLATRPRESNKGSYGHALVIGGSVGKAGAVAMTGFAALRAGAGLSTVATARSVLPTVAGFHPEVMTEPLEETGGGTISLQALKSGRIDSLVDRKTVVAIGPGISRNPETSAFVRELVQKCETPAVLDADALNAFEGHVDQLQGRGRTLVITPHPGEMSRLTGLGVAQIQSQRVEVARQFAREHSLIVVLKGHRTLVASPDGTVWINPTGNPGMATGGTGDVLTGIVVGLIAQYPKSALAATALAVYLHGLAGDLVAAEIGETCLVATDLIRFLPAALRQVQAHSDGEVRFHS
ncbi:MAG TPA: NAD(P)H-hydrate dehydratase [Terriglobales bacterium]|nr:NAD(P)H-hydrate dehydratase [Terriglobales bacterium]